MTLSDEITESPAPAGGLPGLELDGWSVDPALWPDVATVPGSALRGRVAWGLFKRLMRRLPVQVELPDGSQMGAGRAGDPVMRLVRPEAFSRRVGANGLIGFGEAWMAGDWDADDLAGVLTVFARQMGTLIPPRLQQLRDKALPSRPPDELGTLTGARRNIARHYDLSNELFALFLDPTLTYSSALFDDGVEPPRSTFDGLAAAQHAKIDRLLDHLNTGPGTTLLEIGTGWGELAVRAAARGARVHTITLSEEQRELALGRVAAAGVDELVTIDLCDYRDVTGTYDAVVSVEMIEAVGEQFWAAYFVTLDRRLRRGGRVGLQAITMPHDRMKASRDTYTWIHKYIFPGGLIPSVQAIEEHVDQHTRLRPVGRPYAFGLHYAETLRLWRERFEEAHAEVDALGFDHVFRRMWSLYLGYSEAGFRSGYLNVHQLVFQKD